MRPFIDIIIGAETNISITTVQNPAIRDRHWQQLVTATRVTFMMSEDTSLADLLR